jgi:hypothetical protein
MATDSNTILASLVKNYPQELDHFAIKNCSDYNFNFNKQSIHQYILGVTPGDSGPTDTRSYQQSMRRSLENVSNDIHFVPWPYSGDEIAELKLALTGVSAALQLAVDVNRMIKELNVPRNGSGTFYLVVTVVTYTIVSVE